jgi:hypothetical protein
MVGMDGMDYLLLAGLALAFIAGFLWLRQPRKKLPPRRRR